MIGLLRHLGLNLAEKIRHYFLKRSAKQESLRHLDTLPMRRILVLCYGNIYRSALVGRYLSDKFVGTSIEIRSAGFYEKIGRAPPDTYVSLLQQYQIDLSDHRSQLVDSGAVDWADTILIMDCLNYEALAEIDQSAVQKVVWLGTLTDDKSVEIIDPYGRAEPVVRQIIQRLLDSSDQLLKKIDR